MQTRWFWVLTVVVAVGAALGAATLLMHRDHTTTARPALVPVQTTKHAKPTAPAAAPRPVSKGDCDAAKAVANQWQAPPQQDEIDVQRSERLSDDSRDAADSVSDQTLKQDLSRWANAFALLAEAQRLTGDPAATDSNSMINTANTAINQTADELRQTCPDGWPAQP
jgi:hypothetical protein